jgi:DNA-binding response OmpR family regulator
LAQKRVLIVDDDPQVVQTLINLLEKVGGYQTTIAMDGKKALAEAKQSPPDLIILDLDLALLPGEIVCKEIRSDEKTKNVPIIMLTGKSRDADKVIGKVIGADYYMTKPFEVPELLETVNNIFNKTKTDPGPDSGSPGTGQGIRPDL